MIHYKIAQEQILSLAKSFGKEKIELDNSLGRVLAEPITADRDYPPFNRATMDGYAIRSSDFNNGIREFEIVEIIYAGQESISSLEVGQCFKIMTGAAVPESTDIVIRREDTVENDKKVKINVESCKSFQNISRQGEDIAQQVIACDINSLITPPFIAILAALGKTKVKVEQLPKVAIFTTGDEVVSIDTKDISRVQIRDSNNHLLKGLLKNWGITPIICEHVKDDKDELYKNLYKALACDIIIINGGVSAGDADYVPQTLKSLAVKEIFHKVAIRPGRPLWFGALPNGGVVFALPGNPFSCHVTFELFVRLYLLACFGLEQKPKLQLPLLSEKTKKVKLDEFFPVSFSANPLGLNPLPFKSSGDIKASLFADGLALHPSDSEILGKGSLVTYLPF